jgi:hypothetical protein
MFLQGTMFSSMVQQVQLPLQDFSLCLITKSIVATPPPHGEEGGQLGGACCYYVHLKFQLLQNTTPLPKAHKIEIEVAFRDHKNCKLSCVVPLFVFVYKP